MSLEIKKSTQFSIEELVIVTKGGKIDISNIYREINIFDTLFLPIVSGNIFINDSIGLSSKLMFDGSESILISIKKDSSSDVLNFKRAFRIYKQTDRYSDRPGFERYLLHFVSDELIYSDQQRVNQSYEASYSKIVERILIDYLKVPKNTLGGIYEVSSGIQKVVIPNLRPIEAIEWCAKRSLDINQSPNFMFYQNVTGFNFATLSTLLTQPAILDVKYETKNISGKNAFDEMQGARYLEVMPAADNIERTRSGVNAGKFVGFDPITRTISTRNVSYANHFLNMKHGNKTPSFSQIQNRDGSLNSETFNSRKAVGVFSFNNQFSEYIKKKDPSSLVAKDGIESWLFQRKAIIKNLMSKRIKLVMPGNFQLSTGFNVNLDVPAIGKNKSDDVSLNGKYLIVASRQVIGFEKHETILEVATTSSDVGFISASDAEQQQEILNYA
jgi:hypothetical protein